MNHRLASLLSLSIAAILAGQAASAADLKMKFVYGGNDAPEREDVAVTADKAFCGPFGLKDESLIVNPDNFGIKNVVVYVYTGRGGSKLDDIDLEKHTHVLANNQCRFDPRIVIAHAGDTLKVTNPDEVGHNANMGFLKNQQFNRTIPAGGELDVPLAKSEPVPIPVECNIHPWMKAFVMVLDHPYAGVSNADGELVIEDLPEGKLVFRAFHETGKLKEVEVDGKEWKRSRFEVDLKPGMNDMGTIEVPVSAF